MRFVKERLKYEMSNAFLREYSTMLVDVVIVREATDAVFDPVNETLTGGTDTLNVDLKGLFREYKERLIDGVHIQNGDLRFTFIADDYPTIKPQNNDTIESDEGDFRVISFKRDAAGVFYTLQLRRVVHD